MRLSSSDVSKLQKLRKVFLDGDSSVTSDYWESTETVALYDRSFGARIGWKWQGVLNELKSLNWSPTSNAYLIDWGCGSGVATESFLKHWAISLKTFHDRSRLAMAYAVEKNEGEIWNGRIDAGAVLLLSHVLGELSKSQEAQVIQIAQKCDSVLWVEPGTKALSDKMVGLREKLMNCGFFPWAPCPHVQKCGLAANTGTHWCHHFVEPPRFIFGDSDWGKFSNDLNIDLRSLPVSYLVLDRRKPQLREPVRIGRGRIYKGHAKILQCENSGVFEKTVLKRNSPVPLKELTWPRLVCDT